MTLAERVYQTLLDEHGGSADRALRDLAGRYVYLAQGVSSGYMRFPPDAPVDARIDDVPTAITDDWIRTGREG